MKIADHRMLSVLLTLAAVLPLSRAACEDSAAGRVINGTNVPTSQFPTVGEVGDASFFDCTGTLISPTHVLTAGHCLTGSNGQLTTSQTGGRFRLNGVVYNSVHIFVHPAWKGGNNGDAEGEFDAIVMELDHPVPGVTPTPIYRQAPTVGQVLTLAGYGEQGTGATGGNNTFPAAGTINYGTTPIDIVTGTYIKWNFDKATPVESNTAPGDSGGPAFLTVNGTLYVAGITNGGQLDTAAYGDQSYDTRVDAIAAWIDSVSNNAGIYSTPDVYSRYDFVLRNMDESSLTAGVFSNSLSFDYLLNSYAMESSGAPIYGTNGYSIAMWVKADGSQNIGRNLFSINSTNSNAQSFDITTAPSGTPVKTVRVFIRNNGNLTFLSNYSTYQVFDGNWHHVVWVDVNGQAKMFVDGEMDLTDFSYTPVPPVTLNLTSLGAWVRGNPPAPVANTGLYGYLDDIATWNRALSYSEIQAVKNIGIPAHLPIIIISKMELLSGNIRLTITTPDSSKQHAVEQTSSLPTSSWSTVTSAITTILSPTSLQCEFPQPGDIAHFYRIKLAN